MSLVSELVSGASGDEPVTALLRKVKVVAARGEVAALDAWVQNELDGYPGDAELPDYRGPFTVEVLGTFGGPFGSGIKNAPIPSANFPAEMRDSHLFQIAFPQPIAELEDLADGDGVLTSPWDANTIGVVNALLQAGRLQLYEGMDLQQAWRQVSKPQIVGVLDAVRNRILDLALAIERDYPEAGEPEAPPIAASDQQTIVTNIYGNASNVAVASSKVTQVVNIQPGDRTALLDYLRSLNVPEGELDSLSNALDADGEVESQMGPETSGWFVRLMSKAGDLGIGAAGGLIAEAILRYLGIA